MKVKKIGTKILLIACACILMTSIAALVTMTLGSNIITNNLWRGQAETAMGVIDDQLTEMHENASRLAFQLIKDPTFRDAVEQGKEGYVINSINTVLNKWGTRPDMITVTNQRGQVIARTYLEEMEKDLSQSPHVQEAIGGNQVTDLVIGDTIRLSVRSYLPIQNERMQLIGTVSVGYRLDKPNTLEQIKRMSGNDFSIYVGEECINSTIMEGENRIVGSALPDDPKSNLAVQNVFIGQTSLNSEKYYALYKPLLTSEGEMVGSIFAGTPISAAIQTSFIVTLIAIGIVFFITLSSLLIFLLFTKKRIAEPITQMVSLAQEMANGNLDVTINTTSHDEIGLLGEALASMARTLNAYVTDIAEHLGRMSAGDMTVPVTQEYIGSFQPIKTALTHIYASLNQVMLNINNSAEQIYSGSNQVSSTAQALAAGAAEQASAIEQLSATVTEVSDQAQKNAESARQANTYMQKVVEGTEDSHQQMQQMLQSMQEISNTSKEIGKIIKVIDDIAFQTNILALNAAVEAARAGASGKGFAVVADEVRNLAGKSADAAKQTTDLIGASIKAVTEGSRKAENTFQALNDVAEKTQTVQSIVKEIENASIAQANSIEQISLGTDQISAVVQTNAATAEESSAAGEELFSQVTLLKNEVAKFKLSEDMGEVFVLESAADEPPVLEYEEVDEIDSEPDEEILENEESVEDKYL